ncbi:MAG: hypothetical protein ACLQA5_00730 [Solirubrobacteraceae bacterium]
MDQVWSDPLANMLDPPSGDDAHQQPLGATRQRPIAAERPGVRALTVGT